MVHHITNVKHGNGGRFVHLKIFPSVAIRRTHIKTQLGLGDLGTNRDIHTTAATEGRRLAINSL